MWGQAERGSIGIVPSPPNQKPLIPELRPRVRTVVRVENA